MLNYSFSVTVGQPPQSHWAVFGARDTEPRSLKVLDHEDNSVCSVQCWVTQ